jgi:hypothetical protein
MMPITASRRARLVAQQIPLPGTVPARGMAEPCRNPRHPHVGRAGNPLPAAGIEIRAGRTDIAGFDREVPGGFPSRQDPV